MQDRRWPIIGGIVIAVLMIAAVGWAAGRSTAPESSAQAKGDDSSVSPLQFVDGIPVGVQNSRAGALAAADNYVTLATETAFADPPRYEKLVRRAYAPDYQAKALSEAREARDRAPGLVAAYANGRKGVAVVAARRLDVFDAGRADVTSWRTGVVWSATDKPFSQWFLTEMRLRWDGQRWLVEKVDDLRRPAPSPPIRFDDREALRSSTFERELRGMTAPIYGAAP